MNKGNIALLCSILFAVVPLGAHAALLTWQATGTVNYITGMGQINPPQNAATIGEAVTLEWTVDTDTPADPTSYGQEASYPGALTAISLTVAGATVPIDWATTLRSSVSLENDRFEAIGRTYFSGYTLSWSSANYQVGLSLSTGSQSSLHYYPNVDLSNRPMDPSVAFATHQITFEGGPYGSEVFAQIDSVSAVPLPAAIWLLLSGMGAVGLMTRRLLA